MAIQVKWDTIPAEPCCCGDPAHEHPAYEAWIAIDPDYPHCRTSTTYSAEAAREDLVELIADHRAGKLPAAESIRARIQRRG